MYTPTVWLDTFKVHVLHSSIFLCWSYCLCSQAFSSGRFLSIQRMFSSMFSRACWIHLSSAPVSARKELKKLRTWRSREKCFLITNWWKLLITCLVQYTKYLPQLAFLWWNTGWSLRLPCALWSVSQDQTYKQMFEVIKGLTIYHDRVPN